MELEGIEQHLQRGAADLRPRVERQLRQTRQDVAAQVEIASKIDAQN